MVEIENRSYQLQRYYKNKEIINEKQKQYFRKVFYPKNRNKLVDYQRILRKKMFFFNTDNHNFKIVEPLVIERNIRVEF